MILDDLLIGLAFAIEECPEACYYKVEQATGDVLESLNAAAEPGRFFWILPEAGYIYFKLPVNEGV